MMVQGVKVKAKCNKCRRMHNLKDKCWKCGHCKMLGHTKEKCWILNPHLRPNNYKEKAPSQCALNVTGKGNSKLLEDLTKLLQNLLPSSSQAMANLQQLNIGKEEPIMPPTVQAFAIDCSHLSFGTYKFGVASASLMAVASNSTKRNLEILVANGSFAVHFNFKVH